MLVLLRLLMGVGEATFYPSALSLLSRRVPSLQRARATATMQFGAVVGPAIGTLLGGLIMVRYGWRAMFIVVGLASLLWLIAWRRWMRRSPPDPSQASVEDNPPYALILRQRAVGRHDGDVLLQLCVLFRVLVAAAVPRSRAWPLARNDDPGRERVLCRRRASVLLTGWLLDRWIRRGASFNVPTRPRWP